MSRIAPKVGLNILIKDGEYTFFLDFYKVTGKVVLVVVDRKTQRNYISGTTDPQVLLLKSEETQRTSNDEPEVTSYTQGSNFASRVESLQR
ncbi:hypothetical protein LENED_005934 [Lentinula edodes]|uniref:Uncharacterized protein n=1 Tax=Lentinula edodes TaxID=5353 RepID=A0A1Q3EAA8_LENED|nr:hypothetical protein LENED_005934 [Lentinula edodes]